MINRNISFAKKEQNQFRKRSAIQTETRDDLTVYLSEKSLQYAFGRNKSLFVSWRKATMCLTDELNRKYEEPDTKTI